MLLYSLKHCIKCFACVCVFWLIKITEAALMTRFPVLETCNHQMVLSTQSSSDVMWLHPQRVALVHAHFMVIQALVQLEKTRYSKGTFIWSSGKPMWLFVLWRSSLHTFTSMLPFLKEKMPYSEGGMIISASALLKGIISSAVAMI